MKKVEKSSSAIAKAEGSTNADSSQVSQPIAKPNVICRWLGHDISQQTESGYLVCERCGAHEYWDGDYLFSNKWNAPGILLRPIWWIKRLYFNIKYDLQFWYRRKFKGDDLPF